MAADRDLLHQLNKLGTKGAVPRRRPQRCAALTVTEEGNIIEITTCIIDDAAESK
ncbi:hypothetical protein [Rhodococcus sp. ARC_M6]|uniref:hypothetical protein n=1 Tax=Rhodococcus sp. ARC_M6 TaxID=2928852 RepID=UPI001FB2BAF6|nr:hypothetical protein [Rhodococcus sp. ARC_M6]MCJ0902431.1 hypothetical protein [Rhodococcus sp. ARC_M6]